MGDLQLTHFQTRAEDGIRALCSERSEAVTSREIYHGEVPFFSREPQTYVRLTVGDWTIWLMHDEATFSGPSGGAEFERRDYNSEDQLLEALLKGFRKRLTEKPMPG